MSPRRGYQKASPATNIYYHVDISTIIRNYFSPTEFLLDLIAGPDNPRGFLTEVYTEANHPGPISVCSAAVFGRCMLTVMQP